MVVQHNLSALFASNQLGQITGQQQKSTEKLSSGYRINRAADDAAGLSISEKMRKQIRGLDRAAQNTQDGTSLCQVADGALNEVHTMLQRITELSVQAANGTNSMDDRQAIQNEINEIMSEINRISDTTDFNDRKIFQPVVKESVPTKSAIQQSLKNQGVPTGASNASFTYSYKMTTSDSGITFTSSNGGPSFTDSWSSITDASGNAINTTGDVAAGTYTIPFGSNSSFTFEVAEATPFEDVKKALNNATFTWEQSNKSYYPVNCTNIRFDFETAPDEMSTFINAKRSSTPPSGIHKFIVTSTGIQLEGDHELSFDDLCPGATSLADLAGKTVTYATDIISLDLVFDAGATEQQMKDGLAASSVSIDVLWDDRDDVYTSASGSFPNYVGTGSSRLGIDPFGLIYAAKTSYMEDNMVYNFSYNPAALEQISYTGTIKYDSTANTLTATLKNNDSSHQDTDHLDGTYSLLSNDGTHIIFGNSDFQFGISFLGTHTADEVLTAFASEPSGINVNYSCSYIAVGGGSNSITVTNSSITNLRTGTLSDEKITYQSNDLWIQSGADSGFYLELEPMDTEVLGIDGINVYSEEDAKNALTAVSNAIDVVSEIRAKYGAQQNRLEHTYNVDTNTAENLQAAESRIRDTDMSDEMMKLATQNILAQAGQSMLGQAMDDNDYILSLLQ